MTYFASTLKIRSICSLFCSTEIAENRNYGVFSSLDTSQPGCRKQPGKDITFERNKLLKITTTVENAD